MSKTTRAVAAINAVMRPRIKAILATQLSDCLSEAHSDKISNDIVSDVSDCLMTDFDFIKILFEQDTLDAKGRVNAAAAIAAVERTAAEMAGRPGAAPKLQHLAANMKLVFTDIRLLKPGEPNEEET
jgi:hypothetical protein